MHRDSDCVQDVFCRISQNASLYCRKCKGERGITLLWFLPTGGGYHRNNLHALRLETDRAVFFRGVLEDPREYSRWPYFPVFSAVFNRPVHITKGILLSPYCCVLVWQTLFAVGRVHTSIYRVPSPRVPCSVFRCMWNFREHAHDDGRTKVPGFPRKCKANRTDAGFCFFA